MSNNRTKRQHYIPRFYLEYFTDADGMVWTYDQKVNEVRASIPENTAVETNFYSIKNEDGEYNDVLEDWLAGVEGKAASLYPKLLKGEVLVGQEKADFAVFLSSLHVRSPAMIRANAELAGIMVQHAADILLKDRKQFEAFMDKRDAETSKITPPQERESIFEFASNKENYFIAVDQKKGLQGMGAADRLTDIFLQMNWLLIECQRQHLITSDSPVVQVTPPQDYHPIYGDGGFLNKRVHVTVPLTPSKMLELHWRNDAIPGIHPADKQRGRLYNRQRAHFSERYLYASQRDAGIHALGQKNAKPGLQIESSGSDRLAPIKVKRRLVKVKRRLDD